MSWIADAEAGASVRAKLNALMIPISSVAISVPVEYIDIALPSGYSSYFLAINDPAADDVICFALSKDAGVTFFDNYSFQAIGASGSSSVNTQTQDTFANTGETNVSILNMWLASSAIIATTIAVGQIASFFEIGFVVGVPDASGPDRFNVIRFLPLGDADNPPTSGLTIYSGVFHLFGIPSA